MIYQYLCFRFLYDRSLLVNKRENSHFIGFSFRLFFKLSTFVLDLLSWILHHLYRHNIPRKRQKQCYTWAIITCCDGALHYSRGRGRGRGRLCSLPITICILFIEILSYQTPEVDLERAFSTGLLQKDVDHFVLGLADHIGLRVDQYVSCDQNKYFRTHLVTSTEKRLARERASLTKKNPSRYTHCLARLVVRTRKTQICKYA
jgi:hypothetical protein